MKNTAAISLIFVIVIMGIQYAHGLADNAKIQQVISRAVTTDNDNNTTIADNLEKMTTAIEHARHEVEDLTNDWKILKDETK